MKTKSKALIKRHEGVRTKAYKDSLGIWTIGVGHNMQVDPAFQEPYDKYSLTAEQVDMLFDQDFEHVLDDLNKPAFKNAYDKQNEARQAVLENMMFNLGATKLAGFKNFLKHMELQQYEDAVEHMQASKWWGQVGKRAKELAQMVATGEF